MRKSTEQQLIRNDVNDVQHCATWLLPKLLELGNQEVKVGQVKPLQEVVARLKAKRSAPDLS